MKVLLVDDSGTMRHVQRKALAELGITDVTEAADGFEALAEAEKTKPDLVFMDWHMPNHTGIQALREMKASPTLKHIPVIMVSTDSAKANILEARQAGAVAFVIKPFNVDVLREKMAPYLKS
jgi:two-component system, chemotaxis family, chemotaxis protein CheY